MKIIEEIKNCLHYQRAKLCTKQNIYRKMSLQKNDNIWEFTNGIKFNLPHYPYDLISRQIVFYNNFYEFNILKLLDKYIPKNAIILDIGANIGNHSVYWASKGAKSIHSFEPMLQTYRCLVKNIDLNGMDKVIKPYNIGLGNVKTAGEVSNNFANNIGATQIKEAEPNGLFNIKIERLDDIDLNEKKIDFVKIDVEYFETKTLDGMRETLKKYRPSVFIEVFARNRRFVKKFFKELGYKKPQRFAGANFLFLP